MPKTGLTCFALVVNHAPVAIVTGASAGIGLAIAHRLVRRGVRVVAVARRAERLEAWQKEVDPEGKQTAWIAADITVATDREAIVTQTLARFGRIDLLVNNAGFGQRGPLECTALSDLRRNFETNVFSLIGLTQLVIPHLRAQGGGRIINIGSVAGRIARPLTSIYDATKHALEALTDGLRGELRPWNIRVSLVRPGFITTEFIDAANLASEAALANAGPYRKYFEGHHAKSNRLRKVAGTPDDIAKLVEHAACAAHPKTHYSGPFHAKFFLFLKWLLPVRLLDRVLGLKG